MDIQKQWDRVNTSFLKSRKYVNLYLEKKGLRMSLKEFFSLLWINLKVSLKNTLEFIKVVFKYYGNTAFLKADLSLRLMYLFHNPYKISKRFLMKRGEDDVYAYGETPLTSMEQIVKECNIGEKDCVFELGSGRGRVSFWLNSFVLCKVVGIEYVPEFVARAKRIKDKLKIAGLEFRLGDFLQADLKGASVCYLYGTCLDAVLIRNLCDNFSKLESGTKIITVSYPLSDYTDSNKFIVMKRFQVKYTWGAADVYLQVKR